MKLPGSSLRRLGVFGVACLLIVLADATARAQGQALTVGTGCQYADIQTAIDNAASGDTIRIEGTSFAGISLSISGKSLDIRGGYQPGCAVQGGSPTLLLGNNNGGQRVITFNNGAGRSVQLTNFHIRNGQSAQGGGLRIAGGYAVTLSRVQVSNNTAGDGGGVFVSGASLIVRDGSQIHTNSVAGQGGGLFAEAGGRVVLGLSTGVHHNDATDGGGIALFSGSTLAGQGTSIAHNNATGLGGGIYNESGIIQLSGANPNTAVSRNTAAEGGGLYDRSGNILLLSSAPHPDHLLVNNNTAANSGGGLYLANGTAPDVRGNVQIGFNTANSAGGLFQQDGDGRFQGDRSAWPRIVNNVAATHSAGGARLNQVDDTSPRLPGPYFDYVEIAGNRALGTFGQGGGAYARQSDLRLSAVVFANNRATFSGGGLVVNDSTVHISGTTGGRCRQELLPADRYCTEFVDNEVQQPGGGGGALYIDDLSTATIDHVAIMSNNAVEIGAAIWSWGDTVVANSRITDNGGPSIVAIFDGDLQLASTTIANNDGTSVLNLAQLDLQNSIVWGNAEGILGGGQLSDNGCNISQNGAGGSNINPQFVITVDGAYHLGDNSPAVDACESGPGTDLDGNTRPQGDNYDMGAFERVVAGEWVIFLPAVAQ